MADDPPEILYSQFCDLAFIEYADRKWGKKYNCGTALRKQNFGFTKRQAGLQEAITNNRIEYIDFREIPDNYHFQRKNPMTNNKGSNLLGKSFWFVGALIYHPALRMCISHIPNNIDNANPDIVPKLFIRFFVEEENDINLTQNIISLPSHNSSLPINNYFYTDYYITRVKTHFGLTGNPNVDSLFKGALTKTLTQFIIEASRLETTKQFNPFNVINKYNTGDKIIAEMGIPFLIAGYYNGVNITLYPNIPVYQFLLKDRAAYNNERERLARIEAARLARERALIASVVAIHANDAEEPRPLVRDADEDEEDRAAREAANNAVVASIVAINSEEAARVQAEAEAERQRLAREEAERLARELEVARLARELEERQRLAREEANKAVVASIVAINSEQAARLVAGRLEAERLEARQAEAAARVQVEAERLKREAVNKAVVASIIAINSEQAARLAAARVQAEAEAARVQAEAARQAEAAARVQAEAEAEEERLKREAANNKAVVASIVAINSEQAARLAAARLEIERVRLVIEEERAAAVRQAEEEERQTREAARLAREETNKKAVVASIVAINSEQAARTRLAREAERAAAERLAREAAAREAANKATIASIVAINSEQAARVEAVNLNDDNERKLRNSIIAIISAIISNKTPITNTNYNFIDIFYFRSGQNRQNMRSFNFPGTNPTVRTILRTKYETLQKLNDIRLSSSSSGTNLNLKEFEKKIVNIVFKYSFNIYDSNKINQLLTMIRQKSNGVQQRLVIPRFKDTIDVLSFNIPRERSILTTIQNINNNFNIQTTVNSTKIYDIVFSALFITKFLNDGTKYFYVSRALINNYIIFFREIEKYLIIPDILQADFKEMFLHHIRKTITGVENPTIAAAAMAINNNDTIIDNDDDRILMVNLYNTISRNIPLVLGLGLNQNEVLLTSYALKIINFIMFFVGFVNQNAVYFYTFIDNTNKPNVVPWYYGGEDFGEIQIEYLNGNNIRDNIIWCTDNGTIQDRTNTNTESQEQGQLSANRARMINNVGVGDRAVNPNRRNARGNNQGHNH